MIAAAQDTPALTETVNDFAHIIDAQSRAEMDKRIRAMRAATGDVLVVATVPSYEGFGSIDEYAVKMFENHGRGVGDKGKDNGALIVVSVKEHAVRIEVGYDLEAFIPDGFAGETIRQAIVPAFRAQRYGPGLLDASTRLINRIAQQRNVTIPDVPVVRTTRTITAKHFPFSLVFWLLFIVIGIARSSRRGRRRYWGGGPWSGWMGGVGPFGGGGFGSSGGMFGGGGGGGGGGFGGFGGGSSGGGGASGSW